MAPGTTSCRSELSFLASRQKRHPLSASRCAGLPQESEGLGGNVVRESDQITLLAIAERVLRPTSCFASYPCPSEAALRQCDDRLAPSTISLACRHSLWHRQQRLSEDYLSSDEHKQLQRAAWPCRCLPAASRHHRRRQRTQNRSSVSLVPAEGELLEAGHDPHPEGRHLFC